MPDSRLAMLTSILERDPKNLLARYGLAMEYAQQGNSTAALEQFSELIQSNPDYVAAYYQAGLVLKKAGRLEEARAVLTQGLAACDRTGNAHARSEMEAALLELALP